MLPDRRLMLAINAVLGTLMVGAVAALALAARHPEGTERPAPVAPDEDLYRTTIRRARQEEEAGKLDIAEKDYLAAADLRPASTGLRLDIARFYDDHGRGEKALSYYKGILGPLLGAHRLPFSMDAAAVRYGDLLLARKDEARAREAYGAMLGEDAAGGLDEVRSRVYLRAAGTGDTRAEAYLRRAIELDPRRSRDYALGVVRLWWFTRPTPESWYEDSSVNIDAPEATATLTRIARSPKGLAHLRRVLRTAQGVERTALLRAIPEFEARKGG